MIAFIGFIVVAGGAYLYWRAHKAAVAAKADELFGKNKQ